MKALAVALRVLAWGAVSIAAAAAWATFKGPGSRALTRIMLAAPVAAAGLAWAGVVAW